MSGATGVSGRSLFPINSREHLIEVLTRGEPPRRPRTVHYDRARGNLDRHGVHFLAAYVAGV